MKPTPAQIIDHGTNILAMQDYQPVIEILEHHKLLPSILHAVANNNLNQARFFLEVAANLAAAQALNEEI